MLVTRGSNSRSIERAGGGGCAGRGRRSLGLAFALLLAAVPVAAQTGTIQGTVVDASTRQPLAGAQVFIPSTGQGTRTNNQGAYELGRVPAGQHAVRVSQVGYAQGNQRVTVQPGQTASLNFQLGQSVITLNEVVVTGAGVATERRKLGNTIASVDASQLEDKPITTFSEALAGREPGVSVLPSGGMTGEGARIRIRGTSSLSQSNEPLVYVNGVRMDAGGGRGYIGTGGGALPSRLDDIDPSSIERIEVLKGAAAATLYGTEASAGVIQIFTKKGTAGPPRWNLEVEQGALAYPEEKFIPNAGFVTNAADAQRLGEFFGMNIQPYVPFQRDFITGLMERGYSSSYQLSVNGGSTAVTYFASGRYQFEDGPINSRAFTTAGGRDDARKGQGTLTVSIQPTDQLTLRVNSLYTMSQSNTINNNNNIYAPVTLAIFGQPQLANCNRSSPIPGTGTCTGAGNPLGQFAFATVRETFQRTIEQDAEHFNGSFTANYRPLEGVVLDATFGADVTNQRDLFYMPFGYNVDLFTRNNTAGQRDVSDRNFRIYSADTKLSWDTDLSERLNSQFVAGVQLASEQSQLLGSFGRNFPGPGFAITGAGSVQNVAEFFSSIVNLGLFAQEQIGINNWIFTTVGGRYDYNSAFGESAGGAFYPKASISVVPSDMPGWSSDLVSALRFRGAIGKAGKQPGAFSKLTTFSAIRGEPGPGIEPSNLGNPDLKPEVSTEWEVGSEVGLFANRVQVEGTYWNRKVNDALISRQFPVSGGFLARQLDNIGKLSGQGVELGINGAAVQGSRIKVNLFANASYLWEHIDDLGGAPALKVGESYTRYRNWVKEGYAPGAFFGPKLRAGEYPIDINNDCQPESREALLAYFATPKPGVSTTGPFRVLVENGDPRPCGGGKDFLGLYLGKPTPDWSGSTGGNITIGDNWEISTLFEYKAGNFQVHNLTNGFRRAHPFLGGNLPGAVEARATLANPNATAEQRLEAARRWVTEYVALSPYDGLNEVENADFIRWRELSLTYNVADAMARRLGAGTLSLTLSGRNIALWSKYSGIDPEVNLLGRTTGGGLSDFAQGIDAFGLPLPRRVSLTARVGF